MWGEGVQQVCTGEYENRKTGRRREERGERGEERGEREYNRCV